MQKFCSKAVSIAGSLLLLFAFFIGSLGESSNISNMTAGISLFKTALSVPSMAVMVVNRIAGMGIAETGGADNPAANEDTGGAASDSSARGGCLFFLIFNAVLAGVDSRFLLMLGALTSLPSFLFFLRDKSRASGGMSRLNFEYFKLCRCLILSSLESFLEYLSNVYDSNPSRRVFGGFAEKTVSAMKNPHFTLKVRVFHLGS